MGFWEFILGVIIITTVAGLIKTGIRAKHGYPITDDNGRVVARGENEEVRQLTDENAALKTHIGRLEDRIAVLERIVTDPAERTAQEIEKLR